MSADGPYEIDVFSNDRVELADGTMEHLTVLGGWRALFKILGSGEGPYSEKRMRVWGLKDSVKKDLDEAS